MAAHSFVRVVGIAKRGRMFAEDDRSRPVEMAAMIAPFVVIAALLVWVCGVSGLPPYWRR